MHNCGRCIGKCHFDSIEEGKPDIKSLLVEDGVKDKQGKPISRIFTDKEEVMSVIEKMILIYREQGITGERLADTIERIGFDNIEAQLLSDEILKENKKF